MMHTLEISAADKDETYRQLLPQLQHLLSGEPDFIANLANTTAALKAAFGWLWVGFYLADHARRQLVLGPFQGSVACTRTGYGRGVCGQAWRQGRVQVVADVDAYPGHIACSALSRSEIVVPVRDQAGRLLAVLDADADTPACFDDTDARYLTELAALLTRLHGGVQIMRQPETDGG